MRLAKIIFMAMSLGIVPIKMLCAESYLTLTESKVANTKIDMTKAQKAIIANVFVNAIDTKSAKAPTGESWGEWIMRISGISSRRWQVADDGIYLIGCDSGKTPLLWINTNMETMQFNPSKLKDDSDFCKLLKESYSKDENGGDKIVAFKNASRSVLDYTPRDENDIPKCDDKQAIEAMIRNFNANLADEYRSKYPKLSYKENWDLATQIEKKIENIAIKSIDTKSKKSLCTATVWIMEVPYRKGNIEYNVRYDYMGDIETEITTYDNMFY